MRRAALLCALLCSLLPQARAAEFYAEPLALRQGLVREVVKSFNEEEQLALSKLRIDMKFEGTASSRCPLGSLGSSEWTDGAITVHVCALMVQTLAHTMQGGRLLDVALGTRQIEDLSDLPFDSEEFATKGSALYETFYQYQVKRYIDTHTALFLGEQPPTWCPGMHVAWAVATRRTPSACEGFSSSEGNRVLDYYFLGLRRANVSITRHHTAERAAVRYRADVDSIIAFTLAHELGHFVDKDATLEIVAKLKHLNPQVTIGHLQEVNADWYGLNALSSIDMLDLVQKLIPLWMGISEFAPTEVPPHESIAGRLNGISFTVACTRKGLQQLKELSKAMAQNLRGMEQECDELTKLIRDATANAK